MATLMAETARETGTAPETGAAPEKGVVNCATYGGGARIADLRVDEVSEFLDQHEDGQFVWIGLYEPDETLLRKVQVEFGLHDLAIEDALRAHQRPKLEEYGNAIFIVLRTAQPAPPGSGRIAFGETHIFMGRHYIVTVRHGASLSYAEVRKRVERTPELLKKGPAFVLYALMDFVVDQYFPLVDALEEELEQLEEEIFGGTFDRHTTERIYDLKRDLVGVKRAVSPLIDVCNRLVRYDVALVPDDARPYFRDVYDHVVRINETIDNLRELLTTALEAHFSLVAVQQNEVMKRLAAWAAILAVPTAIAGIYGMNFQFMPELHWRYGYGVVMGGIAAISAVLYWRFKRAGWL
jgi:magnesium transporter